MPDKSGFGLTLAFSPEPVPFALSEQAVTAILERPRNERSYVAIPVGNPAAEATVPTHALEKKPLTQILMSEWEARHRMGEFCARGVVDYVDRECYLDGSVLIVPRPRVGVVHGKSNMKECGNGYDD